MSTHLIGDEITAPTTLDPAESPDAAGWLRLSAAMTAHVPDIADREDLVVTIAPGAGHGAPACFLPPHAAIEVNGVHLGPSVDPATATPADVADRTRYGAAWGLLTHECAHAAHSKWTTDPDTAGTAAAEAAELLEESRIEAAQIARRPDDRHWLRTSARDLILADTKADDSDHAPDMSPSAAAHAAALLLARADAGILTAEEVAPVAAVVEQVLGADRLAELRRIWNAAHEVDDTDAGAMLDLARTWCKTLDVDPDGPSATTSPDTDAGTPDGTEGSNGDGRPGSGVGASMPSPLAEAITRSVAEVAIAVAREPAPVDPAAEAAAARAAEEAAAKKAARAARSVFGSGGHRHTYTGETEIAGTRLPTADEQAAARRMAAALTTAGIRERTAIKTGSVMPPGRLRMRGALAADAQRAAGALPTAQPFTRTVRKPTPAPPLRLGIACDVSGSMGPFAGPVASAAWILARAADLARIEATTATVIFGHYVRPITEPGTTPRHVTEFYANDGWENAPKAIDALDAALGLSRPGAARLLVIVSDGVYTRTARTDAQARIARLRKAGCAVLMLAPHSHDPLEGTAIHPLADPAATAHTIGRAATTALRSTR